jgi:Na+/melibiose symporter-like transporter
MTTPTAPKDRIKASWLLAYSLPGLPIAALGLPLAVHLPNFYAVEVGLGYAAVGWIFGAARFFDVFLDPVMGVVSDGVRTPWGRRRIWMVLSIPIMILASVLVFMPSPGVSSTFVVASIVFLYVGWTMLTISHLALGGELSSDYHERSRVTGAREAALLVGVITVLLLPVFIQAQGGDRFAQISSMGWFIIVTLPISVAILAFVIKERDAPPAAHLPIRQAIAAIGRNVPLRYVLFCDLISGISGGIVATLFIAMVAVGLGLPKQANMLLLIYFTMGMLFIPPMIRLSKRFGKHQTLALSCLFNAAVLPLAFLIPKGDFWLSAALFVLLGANMSVGPFLYRAIMADVADQDHVDTGRPRAGVFFSLLALTNKLGYSSAIVFSFEFLDWIGFQEKGVNSDETVLQMMMFYIIPATIVNIVVTVVMWRFPLDEAKQSELRRLIEERSVVGTAIGARVGHTLEDEPELPATPAPKPAE